VRAGKLTHLEILVAEVTGAASRSSSQTIPTLSMN